MFSTTHGGKDAYLIDMEGNVVHRWRHEEGIPYACLLDNGNLLCRIERPEDAGGVETLGASSAGVLELDWDSNIVWEYRDPMLHHDFQRMPNGNTLLLMWEPIPEDLVAQVKGGYEVDFALGMLGDVVREVTPSGETVSEWRSWEFMDVDEEIICHLGTPSRVVSRQLRQPHGGRRPAGELSHNRHCGHRRPGNRRNSSGSGDRARLPTRIIPPGSTAGACSSSTTGSTGAAAASRVS